jgi:hypothetical protein
MSDVPRVSGSRKFRYQRRTPAQWRAAAGPPQIGKQAGWLAGVLNAAARSNRLSHWECTFTADLDVRLAEWGDRLCITPKQQAALDRIAKKLGLP